MFEEKIIRFIQANKLLKQGNTVIIGVSGGPDSLALLHFFCKIRLKWKLNLIVAHVDHMFRGEESAEDMIFVKRMCQKCDVPFEGRQIDVSSYQRETGKSVQVAARECRFAFFQEVMEKHKGDVLALGHHGDDQVETILMRLVRGGTQEALAGMKAKRPFAAGFLIRPFLAVTKEEINYYCAHYMLEPRLDPSNEKETYTRNRFRKHVLPSLKKENPLVHERFLHFSKSLLEDEAYLQELTIQKMESVIQKQEKDEISISISAFLLMSMPLQRRGIHLILNYLYVVIPPTISSIHISDVLSLLKYNNPSGQLHLPKGLVVRRTYDSCVFTFRKIMIEPYSLSLPLQEQITLEDSSRFMTSMITKEYCNTVNNSFICSLKDIALPLTVRSRKQGDKMTLKGMKGSKKIKDIFIDRKIPKEERDKWPLIVDAAGQILWIPEVKKSAIEANDKKADYYLFLHYFK